jgi:hypothetical protein
MFPAKIEVESAQMRASAIAIRFIGYSSFEVEKMLKFLHKREQKIMELQGKTSCKAG